MMSLILCPIANSLSAGHVRTRIQTCLQTNTDNSPLFFFSFNLENSIFISFPFVFSENNLKIASTQLPEKNGKCSYYAEEIQALRIQGQDYTKSITETDTTAVRSHKTYTGAIENPDLVYSGLKNKQTVKHV